MKAGEWLRIATQFLQSRSITSARLDCQLLLEDATRKDRVWLLAHPEYELSEGILDHLRNLLSRRSKHEPLAYIRGRSEFYGRSFFISKHVLVPRPETEAMVTMLLELPVCEPFTAALDPELLAGHTETNTLLNSPKTLKVADIGTGSGAIGITTQLELPKAHIELIDIDSAALKTAQLNVDKFATGNRVVHSDLIAGTTKDYDILLCNLPYVPDDYQINKAASHEPKLALFGGKDGLDCYRKLFAQLTTCQKRPLFILTEALPDQHNGLSSLASANGYKLHKTDNYIQLFARF